MIRTLEMCLRIPWGSRVSPDWGGSELLLKLSPGDFCYRSGRGFCLHRSNQNEMGKSRPFLRAPETRGSFCLWEQTEVEVKFQRRERPSWVTGGLFYPSGLLPAARHRTRKADARGWGPAAASGSVRIPGLFQGTQPGWEKHASSMEN